MSNAKYIVTDMSVSILQQAVEDWRELMRYEKFLHEHPEKKTKYPPRFMYQASFNDIRSFFKSEYGAGLCEAVNLDSMTVLNKLENDLAESRRAYA